MTELFCGPNLMARLAQASDVGVFVLAALGEGDDVIWHGSLGHNPSGTAVTT
jgi:hypothetical protein